MSASNQALQQILAGASQLSIPDPLRQTVLEVLHALLRYLMSLLVKTEQTSPSPTQPACSNCGSHAALEPSPRANEYCLECLAAKLRDLLRLPEAAPLHQDSALLENRLKSLEDRLQRQLTAHDRQLMNLAEAIARIST